MTTALAIVAGSLGALARWQVSRLLPRPLGTAAVNIAGAFLLGVIVGSGAGEAVVRILGAGFLGGFTTFSTWMVEAVTSDRRTAGWHVVGTLAIGVVAAVFGLLLGQTASR